MIPQFDLYSFVFWRKSMTPKTISKLTNLYKVLKYLLTNVFAFHNLTVLFDPQVKMQSPSILQRIARTAPCLQSRLSRSFILNQSCLQFLSYLQTFHSNQVFVRGICHRQNERSYILRKDGPQAHPFLYNVLQLPSTL